jgi:hypothetical protein
MATPFDPTKPALLQSPIQQAAAGAARGGLLSGIGKAASSLFGPVGLGIQAAVTPGNLGNGELTPEQRRELYPEMDAVGSQMKGIADRAVGAGKSFRDEMFQKASEKQAQEAPQENPVEKVRQQAERGFAVQVAKGDLPTKDIATSIVEGQAKQAGEELKPEEKARRISQERTLIDNMPDEQKPNYLSWALVAAGLIASAVDEDAGYYFADSYNKTREQLNEKAEKAADRAFRKEERQEDREFRSEEAAMDRQARADLSSQEFQARREMLDEELKVKREQLSQDAAYQNARLSLLQQKNEIAAQGAGLAGQSKGITLDSDDAKALVKGISKDLGLNLSDGVEANAAAFMQNALKFNPNADPALVLDTWLKRSQKNLKPESTWFGFGKDEIRFGN